jgi:hypothetical protein
MGTFAGAAALYLTATPVRPLGRQTAEIVLFCLFAIALFAVIAALRQTTREITPKRPTAWLEWDSPPDRPVTDIPWARAH